MKLWAVVVDTIAFNNRTGFIKDPAIRFEIDEEYKFCTTKEFMNVEKRGKC